MFVRRISLSAVLLAAAIPAAHASSALGVASGYNLFDLGAYSVTGNSDIMGSAAVAGSLSAGGSYSINQIPNGATPGTAGLVVGGSVTLAGGQLDNGNAGDAWIGGSVTSSAGFTFQHNLNYAGSLGSNLVVNGTTTHIAAASLPIDFSAAATALTQLSTTLAADANNGTVTGSSGSYTLTATGCTLCVFTLPANGGVYNSITINAPTGATVLVNIPGTTVSITNGSITYTGGATAANTLFNLKSATSLTTTGITIYGSILAPSATFVGTNGAINGELIVGAVNQTSGQTAELESNNIFTGNFGVTSTPEPSTWFLMASAIAGLVIARRRHASAANL